DPAFLRKDFSVNLYLARQKIVALLEERLGDIRDYNGGLLTDPVTAYDFEYAWKKFVNPLYSQHSAYLFYKIKNAQACFEKKVGVDSVGIVALDGKTLKVELEHPTPYFLSLCALSSYAPIHKEIDLRNSQWANDANENFVNNGPFLLKKWQKGVEVYVEKNPNYWDSRCVKIDGIQIGIVSDENTQVLMYEKGELDWIGQPIGPISIDTSVNLDKKGELQSANIFTLNWLLLNTEKFPFNNKNFRKAVSYAINRQSLVDHIFQLDEKPAMGILNGDLSVTDTPYFEDGNVELAKKHLDQALLEMGTTLEDLPTLTLSQRDTTFSSTVNQAIQQQLYATLGLRVKFDQADWLIHLDRVVKGDYEFAEMKWFSVIRDPSYTLDAFRYRNSNVNMSFWEHPTYQYLLNQADNEIDPEKRWGYLHRAEALLMEEMPVVPICFDKAHFLCNKHLKGVYISPSKEFEFRYAYFE
nr:peptide ABC transporter substrate-binding protein [Simkaniaceae bacterium]